MRPAWAITWQTRRIPQIFTKEEVRRIIDSAETLAHKSMLRLAYGSGLRLSEITNLKVSDIESNHMRILIRHGKGDRDRYARLIAPFQEIGLYPLKLSRSDNDDYLEYITFKSDDKNRLDELLRELCSRYVAEHPDFSGKDCKKYLQKELSNKIRRSQLKGKNIDPQRINKFIQDRFNMDRIIEYTLMDNSFMNLRKQVIAKHPDYFEKHSIEDVENAFFNEMTKRLRGKKINPERLRKFLEEKLT